MQWEMPPGECGEGEDPRSPFLRDTYHYALPPGLIASRPLPSRDESRLMVLCRETGAVQHTLFRKIRDHLQEGDLLVVNDSKVFPARLVGRKPSGGKVDLLLLQPCEAENRALCWFDGRNGEGDEWECLVRSARRPRTGQVWAFPGGLEAEVLGPGEGGSWRVRFNIGAAALLAFLERHGRVPLPPYIRRGRGEGSEEAPEDRERYQTLFAREVGSVAAPTAGLHFSEDLVRSLKRSGISFAEITLHVGQATFLPIRAEDIRDHRLRPERFRVSEENAERIRMAKAEGRRVVAVGTTVVRCLESLVAERGCVEAGEGWAGLYILPGHRFEAVDAMITNFHLPRTSLLVLVCAFAGRERVLDAYGEAIRRRYRFFSYGDCMLIQGRGSRG